MKFVYKKSNTSIFLSFGLILIHETLVQIAPWCGSQELPTRPYLVNMCCIYLSLVLHSYINKI